MSAAAKTWFWDTGLICSTFGGTMIRLILQPAQNELKMVEVALKGR